MKLYGSNRVRYNYQMKFFKVWAIFNFAVTIFNIIKFYSFLENLSPIKPWVFIILCLGIIAIITGLKIDVANFAKGTFFDEVNNSLKERNNPLLNYCSAHIENSDYYAIFILCFLHFGINSIFVYALLTS